MVDPVGPRGKRIRLPRASSLRVTQTLHEAARVPPMDYRDNPQHPVPHHIKWTGFAPPKWSIFTPPLTGGGCAAWSSMQRFGWQLSMKV